MRPPSNKKYFIGSGILHAVIFLVLVLNYEFRAPLVVIENTSQHDVISAVVLGDTAKSKILPHEPPPAEPVAAAPPPKPVKEQPKEVAKTSPKPKPEPVDKDVIALKAAEKKLAEEKALAEKKLVAEKKEKARKKKLELKKKLAEKKRKEKLAEKLLADIQKQNDKKAKIKQKNLEAKFAKTLREQSEESLRQNLMKENIKLSGKLSRQSQGVINKYKALIIQSIGEHWLVPIQANKSLTSELMIRLAPSGEVLDVKVTHSSGDPTLDSSARAAVFNSSPLPVPSKLSEFEPFRQFVLKVTPENIVEG